MAVRSDNPSRGVPVRVPRPLLAVLAALVACVCGPSLPAAAAQATGDLVAYVGGPGSQRLHAVMELSDGSVLVGGSAENLQWLPSGTPTHTLEAPAEAAVHAPPGRVAFLMRLSPTLDRVLEVTRLPDSVAAEDVSFIKHTGLPARTADQAEDPHKPLNPTGAIYLSGRRRPAIVPAGQKPDIGGYYIARLDDNFVTGRPGSIQWMVNVRATGYHLDRQPWDVSADGSVYYGTGEPYSYNWTSVEAVNAKGQPMVVEHWRTHYGKDASGQHTVHLGSPASKFPGVTSSVMVLKTWGWGDLRSWTQEDYDKVEPDGNGGTKKGAWPWDLFFGGPWDPATKEGGKGKGYTGYRFGSTPCGAVGAIAIDRRTGNVYIGGNNKSRLPDGNPDFEPFVIAFDSTGGKLWWSRLYTEEAEHLSTPDQYVDALGIDYSRAHDHPQAALLVIARCHGNNVSNLWSGNKVKHPDNPGRAFQNHFTGKSGNIHISWLGRLNLTDGTLLHATYIAEWGDSSKVGSRPMDDPNLDGWPSPNDGWPDVNTTRMRPQAVADARGNICVIGTGRRVITTASAYTKMPKFSEGSSAWSDFVRVYKHDLTTLIYSSLLSARWDPANGAGASGVEMEAAVPLPDGLIVVGYHKLSKSGEPAGLPVPTAAVPGWAGRQPEGETGIIARLRY